MRSLVILAVLPNQDISIQNDTISLYRNSRCTQIVWVLWFFLWNTKYVTSDVRNGKQAYSCDPPNPLTFSQWEVSLWLRSSVPGSTAGRCWAPPVTRVRCRECRGQKCPPTPRLLWGPCPAGAGLQKKLVSIFLTQIHVVNVNYYNKIETS